MPFRIKELVSPHISVHLSSPALTSQCVFSVRRHSRTTWYYQVSFVLFLLSVGNVIPAPNYSGYYDDDEVLICIYANNDQEFFSF